VEELPGPEAGRELFVRTWVHDDPRAAPGDGLGPIANGSSCVGCHNQGGVGGGGPEARDVTVNTLGASRNPPALFGAGVIDRVAEESLFEAARSVKGDSTITGRVGRDAQGRPARFGWKGDVDRLSSFVARACSFELGLEVPGFPQRPTLEVPEAPGLDLDHAELASLVRFVAALPAPVALATPGIDHGRDLFSAVGCDGCHQENLGSARGLYADLLLHDLGEGLQDRTGYYGRALFTSTSTELRGATAREWRTPPLWGVRDSAPYLHDGRAVSVEAAIRAHGGEADGVRAAYVALPLDEQADIVAFLDSLVAPGAG